MLDHFISLIFPKNCPGCGKSLLRQDGAVCIECLAEIRPTGFHRHPQDNELYYRVAGKVSLAGAAAYWYFDKKGRAKRIIQGLKYKNNPQAGRYLGQLWGAELAKVEFWKSVDTLLPVPLHRSREASRGYNQAAAISKGLAPALDAALPSHALVRIRKTETQTRKGKDARWQNVKDVFEVKKPLSGHVALVDDVVTTGATLEACMRALLKQPDPPAQISILCLCIARND